MWGGVRGDGSWREEERSPEDIMGVSLCEVLAMERRVLLQQFVVAATHHCCEALESLAALQLATTNGVDSQLVAGGRSSAVLSCHREEVF